MRLAVLYLGETDNLAQHAQERWGEAVDHFGANGIYTRLNITAAHASASRWSSCAPTPRP